MHVQPQKIRHFPVPSVSLLERLQPRIQPPLFLVEQAAKQDDGRIQFGGKFFAQRAETDFPGRLGLLSLPFLPGSMLFIRRPINKLAADLFPLELILPDQLQKALFDLDVQEALQFGGGESGGGLFDEMPCGLHQVPEPRKRDRPTQPKTILVELWNLRQRVILATMRIAA